MKNMVMIFFYMSVNYFICEEIVTCVFMQV